MSRLSFAAMAFLVDRVLDEARSSGLTEAAIRRAGLVGVDVAPAAPKRTQ